MPASAWCPARRVRAARVPFVTLVSLLLLGGVVGLLLFNTSMQQASFAATSLEGQATALDGREQTLRMELDVLRNPQRVAEQAQKQGMVPGRSRLPIDLRQGRILGTPARRRRPPRRRCGSGRCSGSRPILDPAPRRGARPRGSRPIRRPTRARPPGPRPRRAGTNEAQQHQANQKPQNRTATETGEPRAPPVPPAAAQRPARLRPRAAARRLRRDRDGAVGLRCPAGAAPGDRPQVVRRDGGRRGHGPGRAARRARGDPGPQRRAAGRLGRRR